MNRILTRIIAIYLWWFTIVFALATAFKTLPFLAEGTLLGDALIRRPYQWDFELMFTVLFLVWGIFLWRASTRLAESRTFIHFSAWTFLTHGAIFIIIGLINREVITHTVLDSLWWLAGGILLFKIYKAISKTMER